MNTRHGRSTFWFPAKRVGWGWGLPIAWQGWAVLAVYVLLAVVGIPTIHARYGARVFILYLVLLSLALSVVCWLKGEKPRWS